METQVNITLTPSPALVELVDKLANIGARLNAPAPAATARRIVKAPPALAPEVPSEFTSGPFADPRPLVPAVPLPCKREINWPLADMTPAEFIGRFIGTQQLPRLQVI
jgi:hypothetical protein